MRSTVNVTKRKSKPATKPKKRPAKPTSKTEVTRLGTALRTLGGLGGKALGSFVGMGDAGGSFGTGLGATLSRWLGSGDYTVQSNSIVNTLRSSGSIPVMHSTGQTVTIRHKEYITDVTSSTGTPSSFNVFNAYALNPGLGASFPWLSTVAQNFQEYTWKGLVYHYIPTSGDSVASTNTALGSVMLATNYRATAPSYTNKQVMLNEFFSSDAKPSDSFCHPIECDPKENPYNIQYIRTSAVPAGEDAKTYDLGVTSVATQGMPGANTTVGELWCTYEVELRKPISVGQNLGTGLYYSETRSNVVSGSAPLGSAAGTPVGNAFAVTGTTITFPKGASGQFVVALTAPLSAVTSLAVIGLVGTNATNTLVVSPSCSAITTPGGFVTSMFSFTVPDPNAQAVLTTSSNWFTGVVANLAVRIYEVNISASL